jgi:predicted RNA-binding Zn-ribbon protein involved in translation (DUF1610 family)
MSTELVYRMRTCAAALAGDGEPSIALLRDAADLLAEASNLIDVEEPLVGEPMEIIPVAELASRIGSQGAAVWGDQLNATPQSCPSCGDNVSARTVRREGRKLMLTCPKCAGTWEYGR